MITKDWISIKNDQERNLMIRRARTARIIIICSYCIMGLQWFFISVLPIFGVTMRLTPNITDLGRIPMPLQSHYIYDITKRPQYELTFISQAVYVAIGMMAYTGIDNFLSLMVFHICGQLDILENRMQHLDKYKNYHKILKHCIEKHIRLLRAIDIIEDTYNGILLSLFIYFAILFAFLIMTLFDKGNDMSITHLIYFISSIINIFTHMCLYCVLGEILVAQCNKVYYAAYSNKWYTMNPKVAGDLLLLMTRGSKQICLTVGKMSPVTMATFCSLVKTSVGYISVLHTTRR
ncbi:odorant receptor 67c-like [Mycetomoellerius zeteki]|uniref:odorant receptor 67c-like n=1 Tax=Mycetomoellerius zeteki TaxID=64791 RepID=UPI00084E603D|nr:PREDICTED: odorant receptor 67c-like [Trachymyrmex zeteki]